MHSRFLGAALLCAIVIPGQVWADDTDPQEADADTHQSDAVQQVDSGDEHAAPPLVLAIPAADAQQSEAAAVSSPPDATPHTEPPPTEPPATAPPAAWSATALAPPPAPPPQVVEQPEERSPARYGLGVSAGFSSGVGVSARLPLGERSRLMLTVVPVVTRRRTNDSFYDDGSRNSYSTDGFFSVGARWVHYVAPLKHVKFYSVAGAAYYRVDRDSFLIPGVGLGFETGGLSYRGLGWWVDLSYSAVIDQWGLAMLAPLPQTGLIVSF